MVTEAIRTTSNTFWSGAPYDYLAREYVAGLTNLGMHRLGLAIERNLTARDTIAVSAMVRAPVRGTAISQRVDEPCNGLSSCWLSSCCLSSCWLSSCCLSSCCLSSTRPLLGCGPRLPH